MSPQKKAARRVPAAKESLYQLRLYIAGKTARSEAALHNLQAICDTHLKGMYASRWWTCSRTRSSPAATRSSRSRRWSGSSRRR